MRRFYLIGFGLLMGFDTCAQLCFKLAGEHALPLEASATWVLRLLGGPFVYGAIAGYLGAFATWLTLLRHAPIGPAFAASHLEVVVVLFVSHWLFGETITAPAAAGAVLILTGIVLLAMAEDRRTAAATVLEPG